MNQSDLNRNSCMLQGSLAKKGYIRWFHSFTGIQEETGESRTFFIDYFIINPALGCEQPVLGQHPYFKKRGMRPSYVMVKAGIFPGENGEAGRQFNAFYPISSLKATGSPLVMQIEECFYSENHITGFVEVSPEEARHRSFLSNAGWMEWDLEVHKAVACHTGILSGAFFRAVKGLESFWHGEGIRSFFRGTVTLNGTAYQISPDTSYGYADKHWGRSFVSPLFQFASCKITGARTDRELKHTVLAVNGCCPRFLCFPLRRRLMIQLTYMGEDYEFGFVKPFLFSKQKWEVKETNKRFIWHITEKNTTAVIRISCSCTKEQLMRLRYETPEGQRLKSPLWSGSAGTGTVQLYRREKGGKELIDTLKLENGVCRWRQ